MDDLEKKRGRELVEHLERAGNDCGLSVAQGTVKLRCPGAPYTDTPTMTFNETHLQNAVALELLEKKTMVSHTYPPAGRYELDWCVVKKTVGRTSQ
ncbi:MAG: hypothetical protein WB763_11695 [Terriglobia bacterium]